MLDNKRDAVDKKVIFIDSEPELLKEGDNSMMNHMKNKSPKFNKV